MFRYYKAPDIVKGLLVLVTAVFLNVVTPNKLKYVTDIRNFFLATTLVGIILMYLKIRPYRYHVSQLRLTPLYVRNFLTYEMLVLGLVFLGLFSGVQAVGIFFVFAVVWYEKQGLLPRWILIPQSHTEAPVQLEPLLLAIQYPDTKRMVMERFIHEYAQYYSWQNLSGLLEKLSSDTSPDTEKWHWELIKARAALLTGDLYTAELLCRNLLIQETPGVITSIAAFLLSRILAQKGDTAEIELLLRSLLTHPKSGQLHYLEAQALAVILVDKRQAREAQELLSVASKLPSDPISKSNMLRQLAYAHLCLSEFTQAEYWLKVVLGSSQPNAQISTVLDLISLYIESLQYAKCRTLLAIALRKPLTSVQRSKLLQFEALLFICEGDVDAALTTLATAEPLGQSDRDAVNFGFVLKALAQSIKGLTDYVYQVHGILQSQLTNSMHYYYLMIAYEIAGWAALAETIRVHLIQYKEYDLFVKKAEQQEDKEFLRTITSKEHAHG